MQRTKNLLKKFSTTSLTDLHTISSSDDDQPSSLPDNSRLAAIVPAKDESLRQHIDAQANTFEVASETQFTPSSTKSAEARSSHDLVITTSQGSSAQAVDQGQRGASNTTGFDSAISHLKNWMPRKNNKKTTFVAGEIDRGPAMVIPGRPYRQSSPVEAQRSQRLGERDLRNRFSFYAGDESDFVRRKSPAASPSPARHRSLSLSEVPSPQKEDRSAQYQAPDTTRPSSMDTIRRVTMTAPPTDGLFEPRKASRSSVATTVHKPKAASDPLDRAVSTTRLEPGDVPFHGTNGSVRQRRNAVAEPLRTIENAEKTSLAVTGVAKATIASACRDDENSSPIRDRKRKDGGKCKRKTGKNNGA